jgi:nitroimidazol reductase NimA-like FMN-containing flavoprotein (pyridoxamine 5'-phosphate oxidase superfamily)
MHFSDLDLDSCWMRLASIDLGRVAITVRALPVVWPVFYSVLDHSIVFRTQRTSKLAVAAADAVVAFEIDQFSSGSGEGWSVVVQGFASEITAPLAIEQAQALELSGVGCSHEDDMFVSIAPTTLSGRLLQRS